MNRWTGLTVSALAIAAGIAAALALSRPRDDSVHVDTRPRPTDTWLLCDWARSTERKPSPAQATKPPTSSTAADGRKTPVDSSPTAAGYAPSGPVSHRQAADWERPPGSTAANFSQSETIPSAESTSPQNGTSSVELPSAATLPLEPRDQETKASRNEIGSRESCASEGSPASGAPGNNDYPSESSDHVRSGRPPSKDSVGQGPVFPKPEEPELLDKFAHRPADFTSRQTPRAGDTEPAQLPPTSRSSTTLPPGADKTESLPPGQPEGNSPPIVEEGQTGPSFTSAAQAQQTARVAIRPIARGLSSSTEEATASTGAPGRSPGLLIEIDNEEIRTVLTILARQAGVNILVSKSVQGTITATLRDLDFSAALQAILRATGYVARQYDGYIFVGTAEECEQMDHIHGGLGLRVYRPRFVSAKELQALIQPLVTTGVGIVSVSSPAESGIASDSSRTGGDNYAGGDVVIVRDYESVLTRLDQLVAEVDVKPPQVAIQAMILAVRLDDEDALGINFELFRNRPRFRLGWEDPPATLADIRFDAGLKVAFLDGSISSFVSALQQIRDTNVIAAPRLLVLNKHRAEIQIGKEQGYVSTTITETAASQSVDFLDTGTLLRIRPFVLGEKMVRLEVHPELSDGDVRELAGFTVPQKDITQVTTNVLVPDGATVVIGGLIRHELSSGGSQIPVLGSLPWIGALFRSRSSQQIREEIIVLITPHIIHDEEAWQEGLEAKARFDRQFATAAEFSTPLGRRNVARRFYRLAEAAWKGGDCHRARRLVEIALHFDPQLEEALALRDTLASALGERTSSPLSPGGFGPGLSSEPQIAPVFVLPEEWPSGTPAEAPSGLKTTSVDGQSRALPTNR